MHLIEEVNKDKDLAYTLKTKINATIDSITIAGIETLLNIISIAL